MEEQSNQSNQPVPVISNPKKTWIFTIIIIITALAASASMYLWQKSVLGKQKQAADQKITELQNQINQLQQQSSVTKLLLFDKTNNEITATALDSYEKSSFYKITDSEIKDIKYKKDQLVYIKEDSNTDKLINLNIKTGTKQEIDSEYHGYSCDVFIEPGRSACVDNQTISKISEISPNAYYVTYRLGGWEWCTDMVKSLENKSELLIIDGCDTTKWSPDGKRIAIFSEAGMITSNRLALTQKGDIKKVVDIDFDKVQGDVNEIKFSTYQGKKYLDTGFISADFINYDKIVFIGHEYDSINNPYKIFVYDDSKKELEYIKTIEKAGDEYLQELVYLPKLNSVLINSQNFGNTDIGNRKGRFILVDLTNKTQKEIASDIIQEIAGDRATDIEDVLNDGKTAVLSVEKTIYKPGKTELVAKKIFSLDLEKNQYTILSEDKETIYTGFIE